MRAKTGMALTALAGALAWSLVGAQDDSMSFFITSAGPGDGANLGGLEGTGGNGLF